MGTRIKGQEVEVVLLVDSVPQDNLTYARSMDIEFKTELLQEGYLGKTTDDYDSVFKGVSGKIEFHYDTPAVFDLIQKVIDKARRRTPGTRVNVKATLNFPSGRRARVVVRDVEFGPMPLNFGGRSEFGTFSVDYGASEAQVLTT